MLLYYCKIVNIKKLFLSYKENFGLKKRDHTCFGSLWYYHFSIQMFLHKKLLMFSLIMRIIIVLGIGGDTNGKARMALLAFFVPPSKQLYYFFNSLTII